MDNPLYECYLRMKPVCECGYIFDKVEILSWVEKAKGGWNVPWAGVVPHRCPNCKRKILGVYNSPYLKLVKDDEGKLVL